MFEKLTRSRVMFWSVELLVIACLIFVSTKISFIFKPISAFFSTLFAPLLIAGFLYYVLDPFVRFLERRLKIKRKFGILIVFILLIAIISILVSEVIPSLAMQLADLAKTIPAGINEVEKMLESISHEQWFKNLDIQYYLRKFDGSIANMLKQTVSTLTSGMGSIISSVTSAAMMFITVPIILFYMLRDGQQIVPGIQKYLPQDAGEEAAELLHKMNLTLASYISGQAMECLFVAICTFIGYKIVGVEYAFLFAVIAGLTNMIPYLGPYLGLAPAAIVSFFDSPMKAILCCVVVLIVQQIDGNVIYPHIIGKSLSIHPLTIIIILMVAGNIAGVMGMFLGVPFYAIVKTIVTYLYELYLLHKKPKLQAIDE